MNISLFFLQTQGLSCAGTFGGEMPCSIAHEGSRLREEWATIPRRDHDPVAAITAAQWASPAGYRDAVQLARLILIGASIDPTSRMGGEAFTRSLARVWEAALRRMFDELSGLTKWRRVSKERRTRRWDDPTGRDDHARWLIADVIVERSGARWVLDAKYKREFGNESRVDRFQMCAYATAFDAGRVSLVYPLADQLDSARNLLIATMGGKHIHIDSLALPMAAGPKACRAALLTHSD